MKHVNVNGLEIFSMGFYGLLIKGKKGLLFSSKELASFRFVISCILKRVKCRLVSSLRSKQNNDKKGTI